MTSELVINALKTQSGINYVCADCGALLYHTGVDGAFEGGEPGFPSRQPYEVTDRVRSCPNCGRKLKQQPNPDDIRISIANPNQSISVQSEPLTTITPAPIPE